MSLDDNRRLIILFCEQMEQLLLRLSQIVFVSGTALSLAQGSLFIVEPGYRGVIFSRYGGIQDKIRQEGLNARIPWLHKYYSYDVRTRPYLIDTKTGSKDLQNISIGVRILFRPQLSKIPKLHQEFGPDYQEKIIPSIGNEVIKMIVAQYDAGELITQREQVSRQIRENLASRAAEFNLVFDDISIVNLKFGPDFASAVERKQVEQQNAERLKYVVTKNEQEQKAKIIRAEGQSEAAKIIIQAMGNHGSEYITFQRLRISTEIAKMLTRAREVVYLPSAGNMLFGLNE